MLQFRTAHEYYSVLEGFGTNGNTLLDYLVDEGRAGAFAAMVYPEFTSPWLLPEVNQTELRLMKDNLYNTDIEDFMFKNYSYTIGCQIVQAFLEKNPDVSIEEWTAMPADEILRKSKFDWGDSN